jgi:DNA-binding response OmpR family regulator
MNRNDLASVSVLIVEDELLLRKQISASLEKLGADVTGTDSIQRARKLVQDLSFDFVLLDVNLPDGRGTALLEEKIFSASTGVIVMTAHGGERSSRSHAAGRWSWLNHLIPPNCRW